MAFPASTETKERAWKALRAAAVRIEAAVQSLYDQSLAGPTSREGYLNLQRQLSESLDIWALAAGVPGLQAYARDQVDNPTLDLVAEYIAMRDAAIGLRVWIFNNIPRDAGSGAVLTHTISLEGVRSDLMVSSAAVGPFRQQADTLLAAID
jgi:hypothetical protein